ncbi:hypothetical protein THICB1_110195 [Thiomonas arsenitoxydans]|uniref:Transposase n=1 Tax=Thiomonas arsenitoxydans (strain DSM 22701 / CIP 110005 / 3As) TaxID=426114 RepID=A0ABM9T1I7_THIA3|nr:hypothetical protein THICB1_110195 [Thiomonas arsenitoxydans]CQR30025.1 hypothetical protein THICB6_150262 [Thiomonas arsenitoxydans]CQR34309.1 hypothetical protein ACO3_40023 [Thiomonas arsenitoxydans]CQR36885.1 hypothetical protein ACO7_50023 [Thiomonas arsenitoxydans]
MQRPPPERLASRQVDKKTGGGPAFSHKVVREGARALADGRNAQRLAAHILGSDDTAHTSASTLSHLLTAVGLQSQHNQKTQLRNRARRQRCSN